MLLSKFEFNITCIYKYLHRYNAQQSDVKKKYNYLLIQTLSICNIGKITCKNVLKSFIFYLYFYITHFL